VPEALSPALAGELRKPADGSDVNGEEAALDEVRRLRRVLVESSAIGDHVMATAPVKAAREARKSRVFERMSMVADPLVRVDCAAAATLLLLLILHIAAATADAATTTATLLPLRPPNSPRLPPSLPRYSRKK